MNLKMFRTLKGVTQREISNALGCAQTTYTHYEVGDREPSIAMLIKLADYFEVTLDELVGRTTNGIGPLNAYEASLVTASRNADQRARQDALTTLTIHAVVGKKENLA